MRKIKNASKNGECDDDDWEWDEDWNDDDWEWEWDEDWNRKHCYIKFKIKYKK